MAEEKTWKPLDLIKVTSDYLASKDVPGPRLDAEVLLCEIMGLKRRVDLYAGFEREISGKELSAYRELIKRRAAREPVSRILGRRDFMGLTFRVTPDVLSPRPETELLVEAAVELVRPKKQRVETPEPVEKSVPEPEATPSGGMAEELERLLDSYSEDVEDENNLDQEFVPAPTREKTPARPRRETGEARRPARSAAKKPTADEEPRAMILDLGTGSGCIAVSVAAMLPGATVVAVDASPKALAVAKRNAETAGVGDRVIPRQGDWFAGCRPEERFDIILSNPPYLVEGDDGIWPEVSRYDPPLALYGGRDGLDCYRRIVVGALDRLVPGGALLFEVGADQARKVESLLSGAGFIGVETIRDYAGVERIVKGFAPE